MYLEMIYVDCGIHKLYCWNALVDMYSKYVGGLICRMWWSPWRMDYLQGSLCTGYVLWEHEHGEDALNLMNIYLKTGGSFRAVEKDKKCTTVSKNWVWNRHPQFLWYACKVKIYNSATCSHLDIINFFAFDTSDVNFTWYHARFHLYAKFIY